MDNSKCAFQMSDEAEALAALVEASKRCDAVVSFPIPSSAVSAKKKNIKRAKSIYDRSFRFGSTYSRADFVEGMILKSQPLDV